MSLSGQAAEKRKAEGGGGKKGKKAKAKALPVKQEPHDLPASEIPEDEWDDWQVFWKSKSVTTISFQM